MNKGRINRREAGRLNPIPARVRTRRFTMAITAAVTPQRLSWHDFRRVDELPDSSENAQIAPELNLPPRVAPVRGRDNKFRLPSFTIRVTLNRHDTMVVDDPDVMTDALLNHERGHLNIAFLIARQM